MQVKKFTILFLLTGFLSFAQSEKQINRYKSKFFIYSTIGIDSALYYTDKVFLSKKPIDLAFANTAKLYLLFLNQQKFNEKYYLDKTKYYLKRVPIQATTYEELSTIYNITGSYYLSKSEYNLALENLVKAEAMAEKGNVYLTLIKIKINKATIKGQIGLENEAIHELKTILTLLKKNKWSLTPDFFKYQYSNALKSIGNLYCNYYSSTQQKKFLDSSAFYLNRVLQIDNSLVSKAYCYSNLGIVFEEKNQLDKALNSYQKSLELYNELGQQKESNLVSFYIGSIYYQRKDFKKSKAIFLKLENNFEKDTLQREFYTATLQHLSLIYSEQQQKDSAYHYLKLYNSLFEAYSIKDQKESSRTYAMMYKNDFRKLQNDLVREKKKRNIYIIAFIIALVLFIALVLYIRNLNEIKYKKIVSDFNKNNQSSRIKIPQNKISNEQEEKILKELQTLENKLFFLKSEFNQYNAAKKINTNTTYLSQIILKYKNCTFNEYTNNLRIDYLISELMTNTKIRSYTIQALAELIGYKNGTSFSKIFKNKTGVSPYQFIERLKKEK